MSDIGNDDGDPEYEPDPNWRAKMYTLDLLWTEYKQLTEADGGELNNISGLSSQKMAFFLSFKRLGERYMGRYTKENKITEVAFPQELEFMERVTIGRIRDLIKLRSILNKLDDDEDKETIYRIINSLSQT
jgi:hypothetical protein